VSTSPTLCKCAEPLTCCAPLCCACGWTIPSPVEECAKDDDVLMSTQLLNTIDALKVERDGANERARLLIEAKSQWIKRATDAENGLADLRQELADLQAKHREVEAARDAALARLRHEQAGGAALSQELRRVRADRDERRQLMDAMHLVNAPGPYCQLCDDGFLVSHGFSGPERDVCDCVQLRHPATLAVAQATGALDAVDPMVWQFSPEVVRDAVEKVRKALCRPDLPGGGS
jgi:hypothetical protein